MAENMERRGKKLIRDIKVTLKLEVPSSEKAKSAEAGVAGADSSDDEDEDDRDDNDHIK